MGEKYTKHFEKGTYKCSKCGTPLFTSEAKFISGTRWPSFRETVENSVSSKPDNSFLMHRTEILCKKCNQHLGHVFDDGKFCGDTHPEAGKRYCVLSDALDFEKGG